ncbi:MAG: hypothetical protein PVS3B3_22590 [Ktedonobacteraceae bacterium]
MLQVLKESEKTMPTWSQHNVQKHMHVYSSDEKEVGHVEDAYEDSFKVHKGLLPIGDRYYPYTAIESIENSRVQLLMTEDEAKEEKWTIRPDTKAHEADPIQLFYDRGHGVQDPFDETNPTA